MSVYNQPTSNVQSDDSGGTLVSDNPSPVSAPANPLIQGLHFVANTFAPLLGMSPGHSDEATESLSSSSSSYYSLSSSSSGRMSSEGDALSVDAYSQSGDDDAEGTHNPALDPSEWVRGNDILDASPEILDYEEEMLDADYYHPNAFDPVIDVPLTSMGSYVFSSNYIEPLYTETGMHYGNSRPRRRHTSDYDYRHDVLNSEHARVSRAAKWAKVERLARKWKAMQDRREAAEREQDRRMQMSDEEAELEMEQKERNLFLLEGEREMFRQQELREAAAGEDQRLQQNYLNTRGPCFQYWTSDLKRALEDIRACRAGLISEDGYIARRNVCDHHYTRDRTAKSRSFHNHFHPYSSSSKSARSNNRQFNTTDELDDSYDKLLIAGRYAFKVYHDAWDRLITPGNEVALTFRTVPWPLITSPYTPVEITKSRIWEFLCRGFFDGSGLRRKHRECVLEEELRRWHPDSVETWIIPYVVDKAEHAAVRQAATTVHGALVLLIAST